MLVEAIDIDHFDRIPFSANPTQDLIDNLNDASKPFVCLEQAPSYQSRRWRPAIIVGDGVDEFASTYFSLPAALPWSGFLCAQNARIGPVGIVHTDHRLMLGHSLMYPKVCFPYADSIFSAQKIDENNWDVVFPKQEIKLSGTICNLCSPGLAIYGHWIVDLLPRLFRAASSGIPIDKYVLPLPKSSWQQSLLHAAGVADDKVIFVDLHLNTVLCERLITPTFDRFNSEVKNDLLRIYIDIMTRIEDIEVEQARKIFISRGAGGRARPLHNRKEIENVFAEDGFDVVRPEELSFVEQIRLFRSASVVAGECGSGLHNSVFSKPGTKFVVIQAHNNPNFLQSQLAMIADQQIWYLIGKSVAKTEAEGFRVDVDAAKRLVRQLADS